jgi:hypothetical protein
VYGERRKGTLKVELSSTMQDRQRRWACAAIDVEDADTELEVALGVGPSAAAAVARCSAQLETLRGRHEPNARPRRDAEAQVDGILQAATYCDTLVHEAQSPAARRRSARARAALRTASDPEARSSRGWVISASLKAALQDSVRRLVEDQLAADSTWSWDDVPLDEQERVLRELFRNAGLAAGFRWDLRHDFPLV